MKEAKRKVEKLSGLDLNADLGAYMLIEPAGMGGRFKTLFIGMERGRYIIVGLPRITGVNEYLYVEKPVTVRYTKDGQVYGFSSEILYMTTAPFRLAFLRFPKVIEALNLRKTRRIECCFQARVSFAQDGHGQASSHPAMITDISSGGCQTVIKADDPSRLPEVAPDRELVLNFKMFGSDQEKNVKGRIKNIQSSGCCQYLGVKFDEISEDIQVRINEYIQSITDHLKA